MACRQLHRQRTAAHVAGENRSGKHGGVSAQKGEHRHDHRLEQACKHRCKADDPHHGQRQRTHGKDSRFKFLSQSPAVPKNPVNGAGHRESRHNCYEDLMK